MFFQLLGLTQKEAVKRVRDADDLPPMVRVAAAGALTMMSEADYNRYRDQLAEGVNALAETDRGRKWLKEIGIEPGTANHSAPCADCPE